MNILSETDAGQHSWLSCDSRYCCEYKNDAEWMTIHSRFIAYLEDHDSKPIGTESPIAFAMKNLDFIFQQAEIEYLYAQACIDGVRLDRQ